MSEPFIAEIRIMANNYAPYNWAQCNGQEVPISQNTALYALLGTTYGGNGHTTFALPNLMGRASMQSGAGPGLTARRFGEASGEAEVTLTTSEMPMHSHTPGCYDGPGNEANPADAVWAGQAGRFSKRVYAPATATSPMTTQPVGVTGSGASHNNMQPYLGLNFVIALYGVFPQRP